MQEIPSDVLLLTIDYLDSPTIMSCRQVSRKWLDVVDGNQSLYSFFYLPKDSKSFSQEMFDHFAEKSVSGLKGVSISQTVLYPEKIFESLLNSNSTRLRYFLLDSYYHIETFSPRGLSQMSGLYNFCYYSTLHGKHTRFRLRDDTRIYRTPSNSKATCSLTNLHLLDSRPRDYSGQVLGWCSASLRHLAIMIRDDGPFETLRFPNLQALELHYIDKRCTFPSESCPNLKVIYLNAPYPDSVSIEGLPASLEKLWLSWSHTSFSWMGLSPLDSSLPHLEDLRLEKGFGNSSKALDLVRARRLAVEQGVEVGGIKMKPLKKLTVSKEKFSNENWLALEGLVEELVDLKEAPAVEEISV